MINLSRFLLTLCWVAACVFPMQAAAQTGATNVVTTERVRAELMAHAPEGVEPGKAIWVGLQLAHQPEWHTYWKNSGDSGLPTQLQWTLPPGVVAGDIAWPLPKKIPIGTLANYGYEGTVLLPVPLTITSEFRPASTMGFGGQDVEIKLKAEWLVCKKECIPEEGEFSLKIPVRSSTALHASVFNAGLDAQPKALSAGSSAQVDGQAIKLSVAGLPAALRGKTLDFFPETGDVIETAAAFTQGWNNGVWTASIPLSAQRSQSPAVLPVVLALDGQGWRTEAKVLGAWPSVVAAATVSPALEAALRNNAAGGGGGGASNGGSGVLTSVSLPVFAVALLGALLGGMLLNLMPCVFPVLAIKVVGFTRHAADRRGHRISGLAYSAGVVLSFVALGAVLIGLRAAGEQLGWGFQLQSPAVVAALAALFTLIGLNLAGVFEFGAFLPSSVASMEARHPVANSFFSGVLAAAIASPCTAPFMGASVGLAIGLPAAQALLIFAAVGLGMALPYLAASWVPAVARLLPRPGAWMDTFRKLMAFPMFATVAWLVWVLGQQSGIDGAGALLALLVTLSMVVWALTLKGKARTVIASISIASLALLTWAAGGSVVNPPDQPLAGPVGANANANALSADGATWQSWAPGRVDQLLASGQPVFVDFTAAWCVTCQYNKKTTLANSDVLADLAAKKVVLLRADWTRRDPAITAALAALGRNGVPVYVFYKKGGAPVVLSEILGVEEVRLAIANL